MGSGCSVGAICMGKAKAPQKLSPYSGQRFHKTTPFLKLPSSPTEEFSFYPSPWTADKTAKKLHQWNDMCTFHSKQSPTFDNLSSSFISQDPDFTENLFRFALTHTQEFSKRLTSGPPAVYRWAAWKTALQVYRHFVVGMYDSLKSQKATSKWLATITSDVARTFVNHSYDREALENILVAYGMYNESVGYCQGMSFLAALLLIVSDSREEEAFWAFVALMERKVVFDKLNLWGANKLYAEYFPLVRTLESLFEAILGETNSELKAHLNVVGLPTGLWLHQWISSLFLYTFPMQYCVRFWDALLGNGISFLLPITCAVLGKLEAELLKSETMEECYEVLKIPKSIREKFVSDPEEIVKIAKEMDLDWGKLDLVRGKLQACIEGEKVRKTHRKVRLKRSQCNPQSGSQQTEEDLANMENKVEELTKKSQKDTLARALSRKLHKPSPVSQTELKLPPIKKAVQFVFEFNYEPMETKTWAPAPVRKQVGRGVKKYKVKKIGSQTNVIRRGPRCEGINTTVNTEKQNTQTARGGTPKPQKRPLSNHGIRSKLKLMF